MNPTDWHALAQLYPALGEAVSASEALVDELGRVRESSASTPVR